MTITQYLTLRLFARERIGRLGKGALVEEVDLAPFRGKDYRHKTVYHPEEAGVLRFLPPKPWGGREGSYFVQIKDRCSFLREAILSN